MRFTTTDNDYLSSYWSTVHCYCCYWASRNGWVKTYYTLNFNYVFFLFVWFFWEYTCIRSMETLLLISHFHLFTFNILEYSQTCNCVSTFRLFLQTISLFICSTSWKFLILIKNSNIVSSVIWQIIMTSLSGVIKSLQFFCKI